MKIVKGKEKEYEKYVALNSKDGYSRYVIDWTESVGKLLDKGKTPEEADRLADSDEGTGFQAGCVAQIIAHFHPRGKEFQKWWNNRFGVKNAKGVVNPAIFTMKSK